MGKPPHLAVVGASGAPADNPWAGAAATGDEYDATGFYVRSTDNRVKGDSSYIKVRFPAEVVAEVGRLIASGALGGTPIDGFQAFVRDALVHNMHRIGQLVDDGHFTEAAGDQRRLARAETLVREREAKTKIVADATSAFDAAMAGNDHAHARELLALYEPMVDRLREPYGSQLEGVLKRARQWASTK